MLTAIREKATGWIAWFIAILITVPMALWGINSYFEGGSEVSVASVNGEDISYYTYQEDLQQQQRILQQRLGSGFDPELLETLGIRQRVLDNLVNNQLLLQFTNTNNFRISDDQLRELIQGYPTFQVDGKFDSNQYQQVLRSNGFTPESFEHYQRANEANNQLAVGISETGFVTPEERERLLALQTQERKAKYALIEANDYIDSVDVTDEEKQDYYDRNKDLYNTEERLKVDYIELSVDNLRENISPTPEEVRQHYEDTKGRYQTAGSRKASHILIASAVSDSDDQKADKLALAEELLERARSGEDFSTLAAEYSDDPGSRDNGGDLGVVTQGQMVKPFEDAVFAMAEGDIEGPIETTFGYHIIKLTELRAGEQQSLDEVRDQVAEQVSQIMAEEQFADLAESFKNLVFEDPDNITTAADALDLPVMSSDWFTAFAGEGVADDPQVRRAAFEADVLEDGLVSAAIEIGFDRLVAVQKSDHEPVRPRTLDEVSNEVEEAVRQEKVEAIVVEKGSALVERLADIQPKPFQWSSEVVGEGLRVENLPLRRVDYEPGQIELAESVFTAERPAPGTVTVGGVITGQGDYAVFALESVELGNPDLADEAVKAGTDARLMAREGDDAYQEFIDYLRENAEIVVYEDQL